MRVLKGAKPSDLPMQAPARYETVLDLKTAKAALGSVDGRAAHPKAGGDLLVAYPRIGRQQNLRALDLADRVSPSPTPPASTLIPSSTAQNHCPDILAAPTPRHSPQPPRPPAPPQPHLA